MKFLSFLLVFIPLVGCQEELDVQDKVTEQCKEWSAQGCKSCAAGERGEFKLCYYDSSRYPEPKVVRENCLGVHVGYSCEPCESIFALNFGGSLTGVSCENFFTSIEKRNAECKDCIKRSTALE